MKYIILFFSIFLLTGCKEKIYVSEEENGFSINKSNILVYDDVYLNDILNITDDIELLSDNYKIDTDELGNKTYEIMYKYDKKKYVYSYELNVVDNVEPLVFSGTNRTILKGYTGNICDLIMYGDNYTGDLKCEIVGDYDVNKIGKYNIIYNITDSSNNTKRADGVLNVVGKINSSTSYNILTTPISEAFELYKEDNNEIGIDVSEWQGNIDFNKVKETGITFVIMRIGVQTKDGLPNIDGQYKENIRKAKEAGLKVGVYLYSIAGTKEEAQEQAKWVVDTLDGEALELGVTFDWENWKYWNSYKISFHDINEIANTFMKTIRDSGYSSMLYGSKFYLETIWTNKYNYPVWLAHYIDGKSDYKGDYVIWQLCNNGIIDGINGSVDIDIMYNK